MSVIAAQQKNLNDREMAAALHVACQAIQMQINKKVVGQRHVVEHLLTILLAHGHGLFVGVPGLGKTLLIQTLAEVLQLDFNRVQFTPDLMPSDITGSDILEQDEHGHRFFKFLKGPVFCNILLADEINRTPPKTQAALLQAMQESHVTTGGKTYDLMPPFHVFATQNPIEQEGTYPLPEAQLDRFMMMLQLHYPTATDELQIIKQTTITDQAPLQKMMEPAELLAYQSLVLRVPVADPVLAYAIALVRATRPTDDTAPDLIKQFVNHGAGPRAAQHLILAAKARCLLQGRFAVDKADIQDLLLPVLRHRIMLHFSAESQKITSDHLLQQLLKISC